MSIITYGMGVHWAKAATKKLNVKADILDLRTLLPLDKESIFNTVQKTNKVLILHEDCLTGGIGGELSALINEYCFEDLDAPYRNLPFANLVVTETGQQLPPSKVDLIGTKYSAGF